MPIRKREPQDNRIEREIAIGAITSKKCLREISRMYDDTCMTVPHLRLIVNWCIEYWEQYNQPPGRHIQDLFLAKTKGIDDAHKEQIEIFLVSLSEEFQRSDKFNAEYLLDQAELHFNIQRVENLKSSLSKALAGGRIEEAQGFIADYSRIQRRPSTAGIDPIRDREAIAEALSENSSDRMFALPGDIGQMVSYFERDQLVMVVGPQGRGKSFWLQEIGIIGLLMGFNVLFVSLELSEKQILRRIQYRLTGLPARRHSGNILIPVFDCLYNQNGNCPHYKKKNILDNDGYVLKTLPQSYNHTPCTKCMYTEDYECAIWQQKQTKNPLTIEAALDRSDALERSRLRGAVFKILDPPPNSLRFSDLRVMINNWEYYDGWVPDIVITDYADKFLPEKNSPREYRHMIYRQVVEHKALAKERHILVVSASQSDTGRNEEDYVTSGGFAEDIRKKGEIDIGFSLNQTSFEKRIGKVNIFMMKIRDDIFDIRTKCIVLQQLKLGMPCISSYWHDKKYLLGND